MPILFTHGIGVHDLAQFQRNFRHVRDHLRTHAAQRGVALPEAAFFPVFWGDWGPRAVYRGRALQSAVQPKSLVPSPRFDPAFDAVQTVLSAPGPLRDVLAELGIPEADLLRAVAASVGQPDRAALTVKRLMIRTKLGERRMTGRLIGTPESWEALRSLLTMILEPPRIAPKGMGTLMAYPFWATVTALAKHMRVNIMQTVTDFLGDALNYIARGSEVRWILHAAVIQACALRPNEPLVLIGHSLGGIISYEYLIDPNPHFQHRPEQVTLITVGSPVALFAEYDLFARHGVAAREALGMRWVNIFDPDDLLSFPVAGVFPERADGDRPCPAGRPFPASHSAYWQNERVFDAIVAALPAFASAAYLL